MKAIIVMFDSLNRHMLGPYGSDRIKAPNFERLARRTVTFDNFYAGSMPCMPARREIHTGRYNFLHRSWGPLEPFDDSMPEILGRHNIHTHLATDHPHYWEDGGATYHPRYTTFGFFRGQEGDGWKGHVQAEPQDTEIRAKLRRQDALNRVHFRDEAAHPQTRTFDAGIEFLETNVDADNWMLQIECFDPHEPFFSYENYKALYPHEYSGPEFDWPGYEKVTQDQAAVEHLGYEYAALVSMCDRSLGRVLDFMDEHDMWDDTMLMVNTDHGFLLGEHGWWAKAVQPWFNELIHIPMFLWDPRNAIAGERSAALAQTIDIAPTMLDFFGIEPTPDMQGRSLRSVVESEHAPRDSALFGIFGAHVNVTDGRYVYMRACSTPANEPLEEYTLMPTHMRGMFTPAELEDAELAAPFSFTKNVPTLRLRGRAQINPFTFGSLLFDLETDPMQERPIVDDELELRMINLLVDAMRANDAPRSQFERLGLPLVGEATSEHLLVAAQAGQAALAAEFLPPLDHFPTGRIDLTTPIGDLLASPRSRAVLERHAPVLLHTELVEALGTTSVYRLAAALAISIPSLEEMARELAAL